MGLPRLRCVVGAQGLRWEGPSGLLPLPGVSTNRIPTQPERNLFTAPRAHSPAHSLPLVSPPNLSNRVSHTHPHSTPVPAPPEAPSPAHQAVAQPSKLRALPAPALGHAVLCPCPLPGECSSRCTLLLRCHLSPRHSALPWEFTRLPAPTV